jgi:hypothetical protein
LYHIKAELNKRRKIPQVPSLKWLISSRRVLLAWAKMVVFDEKIGILPRK